MTSKSLIKSNQKQARHFKEDKLCLDLENLQICILAILEANRRRWMGWTAFANLSGSYYDQIVSRQLGELVSFKVNQISCDDFLAWLFCRVTTKWGFNHESKFLLTSVHFHLLPCGEGLWRSFWKLDDWWGCGSSYGNWQESGTLTPCSWIFAAELAWLLPGEAEHSHHYSESFERHEISRRTPTAKFLVKLIFSEAICWNWRRKWKKTLPIILIGKHRQVFVHLKSM